MLKKRREKFEDEIRGVFRNRNLTVIVYGSNIKTHALSPTFGARNVGINIASCSPIFTLHSTRAPLAHIMDDLFGKHELSPSLTNNETEHHPKM